MGGIAIGISILISSTLFGNFENINFIMVLGTYMLFAFSGFIDDFIKLKKGRGLSISKKVSLQTLIALTIIFFFLMNVEGFVYNDQIYKNTFIGLPFTKELFDLGSMYYFLCFLIA